MTRHIQADRRGRRLRAGQVALGGRLVKRSLLGILAVLAALGAEPATASTGQITRAHANATFTQGSLAGNVNWTDCVTPGCQWIPYASVQPSLPSYRCVGDEIFDNDPNTRTVWNGGGRGANGTAAFDLPQVPILSGVYGQRLCLMVLETLRVRDPICVAQAPILGMDPSTCPFINRHIGRPLASALLTVPPPPVRPSVPPTTTAPPAPTLSGTRARRAARRALARKFGGRWRKGTRRRVTCRRLSTSSRRCKATWRYSGARRATVTVRLVDGRIRTRVSR